MTTTQGDLASLSRYIFSAPSWYASVAFSLLIAALAGVAAFDSRYVLEDAWQGVFFIGIPTVLASVLTPWVDRRLGGQLTPNRASLLALFCELVTVGIMTPAGVVLWLSRTTGVLGLDQDFVFDVLIAALAAIFAFRLLVLMAVSRRSIFIAAIPASLQTLFAAVLLFVYSGTMRFFEIGGPIARSYLSRPEQAPPGLLVIVPDDFVLLGFTCVLYAGAVWAFLTIIDRPWKRGLGVSVLDFLQGFLGHIAEGTRELEDFFEQIGEEAVVPVTVLSFRRTEAAQARADGGHREKARFVLPMIHPGPMGEIGGGNLPEQVAQSTTALAFPPHATAGHDFNLVTAREVDTVLEAAEAAAAALDYDATGSPPVRTAAGEATILGQAFGDSVLLVSTYAPNHADDVEYAVGLSAAAGARTNGLEDVMLVDAHNSNRGLGEADDLGHVTPGSRRSFEMIRAADEAGDELSGAEQSPLRLGVAWSPTDWGPDEGIGPLGVRVAVLETGGQRVAYVLADGNNMTPALRCSVIDRLTAPDRSPTVDAAEVMTTDTHVVNLVDADNRVGAALPDGAFCDLVVDLVEEAMADLDPVEAGMATERAEVTVFGNDRTETLASYANVMISIGSALAVAFVLAVAAVSFVAFIFA